MQPLTPHGGGDDTGMPPPGPPWHDMIYRTPEGLPLRWRSLDGAMHAAEGARGMHADPRSFEMWTRGLHDIPPEAA